MKTIAHFGSTTGYPDVRSFRRKFGLIIPATNTSMEHDTNMSLLDVTEKLEPVLGIPLLGVSAVLFWHALRESGFTTPLAGAGRLLKES